MAQAKKTTTKAVKRTPASTKKSTVTKRAPKVTTKTPPTSSRQKVKVPRVVQRLNDRRREFLSRRPHRSFQVTKRRDYVRSLKLPGYWSFTAYVTKTLWKYKKMTASIVLLYAVLTFVFVGMASQSTYASLSDTIQQTSGNVFKGVFGGLGKAGLLLATGVSGNFSTTPTGEQQLYGVIIGLLIWLTTVWALRALLAGRHPRFRDALYNAGAPIVPTFLVLIVIILQLIPAALGALFVGAAISSGLTDSDMGMNVISMMVYVVSALLVVLSLYWITGGLMALIVVTLPGKYPMQAIRMAGDLVVGRRLRILLRIIWLAFVAALVWVVIMIPLIMLDSWVKSLWKAIAWVPFVPFAFLVMSSLTIVFVSAYIYLLYRKVVDDDAAPA